MAHRAYSVGNPDSPFAAKGVGQREKLIPDLFMQRHEIEAMSKAIHSDSSLYSKRFYPLFFILANFGLRISEAVKLVQNDFRDLASGFFHVERAKKKKKSAKRGKGKKDRQSRQIMNFVYVNEEEIEALREILSGVKTERIFPFSVRMAQLLFGRYLKLAGLRMIYTPHCIRRFVASEMDDLGINNVAIKARLGHALDSTELYLANPQKMSKQIVKWRVIR